MFIKGIIETMNLDKIEGLQLSKQFGIITTTWLLYRKNETFYYFDINDKIEFTMVYEYSEEELIDELKNSNFQIEMVIS